MKFTHFSYKNIGNDGISVCKINLKLILIGIYIFFEDPESKAVSALRVPLKTSKATPKAVSTLRDGFF